MAAWHEPRAPRFPWVAFTIYVAAMLGLFGWVLYRVVFPLSHMIP